MRNQKTLLHAGIILSSLTSAHAASIALVNAGFEQPGTVKIVTGFDATTDVPGWINNNSSTYTDSGVETTSGKTGTEGSWAAFLLSQNGGAYQATSYTIVTGDQFTLSWAAGATSNTAINTPMLVTLFRTTDGGATRTVIATSTANLGPTNNVFQNYTLNYTATGADAGAQIGIEFEYNNASTGRYAGFDNFVLDVVPEPSVALLGGLGLIGLLRRRR